MGRGCNALITAYWAEPGAARGARTRRAARHGHRGGGRGRPGRSAGRARRRQTATCDVLIYNHKCAHDRNNDRKQTEGARKNKPLFHRTLVCISMHSLLSFAPSLSLLSSRLSSRRHTAALTNDRVPRHRPRPRPRTTARRGEPNGAGTLPPTRVSSYKIWQEITCVRLQ